MKKIDVSNLKQSILELFHEGPFRVEKCKKNERDYMYKYWSGIELGCKENCIIFVK